MVDILYLDSSSFATFGFVFLSSKMYISFDFAYPGYITSQHLEEALITQQLIHDRNSKLF